MREYSPHRKLVKHDHEPGEFHEFTCSCYRRLPPVTRDAWRTWLARSIGDWKWPNARWYLSDRSLIDPDLPTIHGPPPVLYDSAS